MESFGGANTYGYLLPRFSALKGNGSYWLVGNVLPPRGFSDALFASGPPLERVGTSPALFTALRLSHKYTELLYRSLTGLHESISATRIERKCRKSKEAYIYFDPIGRMHAYLV